MGDTEKDIQGVTELLAKTKVDQVNVVSFKGKSLKLNSIDDGELVLLNCVENDYMQTIFLAYNKLNRGLSP